MTLVYSRHNASKRSDSMETQTEGQVMTLTSEELERMVRERVDAYLQEKEAEKEQKIPKLAIIASKGTLDMAYPPLILATTAAALGYEVQGFFTFYGLQLLRRDLGPIKI